MFGCTQEQGITRQQPHYFAVRVVQTAYRHQQAVSIRNWLYLTSIFDAVLVISATSNTIDSIRLEPVRLDTNTVRKSTAIATADFDLYLWRSFMTNIRAAGCSDTMTIEWKLCIVMQFCVCFHGHVMYLLGEG